MKEVLTYIEKKNQEYASLPIFDFLQDQSISPRKKLIFAPIIAPLAMGFGELCNNVFREEPTSNKIQELINRHTYEEHFHWKWLLEDIEKLDLNPYLKLTDAMKFLFGEETKKSRALYSRLERYTFQADPIIKLAVVQVAEVTANVFFRISKPIALELQKLTGKEYRYFGMSHMDEEDHHHINTPNIINFLQEIELTQEQRENTLAVVDLSFQAYTEAMNEFMVFVEKHNFDQPLKIA